jgi:exonuclease 3'-5' domain-containing protein 1
MLNHDSLHTVSFFGMAATTSSHSRISTASELDAFLSSIPSSSTLYVDLEGDSLSRDGTIYLITILIHPQRVMRFIDVLLLGKLPFTTASSNGKTLKSIFEDLGVSKCAWDFRNVADALWGSLPRQTR